MFSVLIVIFVFSMIVALSGAMVPGPLLTYTIIKTLETSKRGYLVGFWVILGHALIEMVIIVGILMGFSVILTNHIVVKSIGTAGGAFLVYMGMDIVIKIIKRNYKTPFSSDSNAQIYTAKVSSISKGDNQQKDKNCDESFNAEMNYTGRSELSTSGERSDNKSDSKSILRISNPVLGGILVSMSNPYWWVWWATVGFGFMLQYGISLANWQSLTSFYVGHETGDLLWYALVSTLVYLGRRRINQRFYTILLGFCSVVIIGFGIFLAITAFLESGKPV